MHAHTHFGMLMPFGLRHGTAAAPDSAADRRDDAPVERSLDSEADAVRRLLSRLRPKPVGPWLGGGADYNCP
jgi:hypothetical protein